jgi:hypothetical protein
MDNIIERLRYYIRPRKTPLEGARFQTVHPAVATCCNLSKTGPT